MLIPAILAGLLIGVLRNTLRRRSARTTTEIGATELRYSLLEMD